MRHLELKLILLILLICLAFASAAYALKPLVYRVEKTIEIEQTVEQFRETVQTLREEGEEPSSDPPAGTTEEKERPFAELLEDMQYYNAFLCVSHQSGLNSRSAYEVSHYRLVNYGLPSEVFGVLSIPVLELEMPIYLGASESNMANGAAVLAQTSIPIGGDNSNAVIAGHRGWNGYPYFLSIDTLRIGDEVIVTNPWETLRYEVAEIQIVSPDDIDAILIQPGRDMITLLTCHPPNSGGKYRYLVYCERVCDG